jgi:hypothetical protein
VLLARTPLGVVVTLAAALPLVMASPAQGRPAASAGDQAVAASGAARATPDYVIMAANDLGMHCIQNDYSAMMILPPANFLHVQVFRSGGEDARLVTTGIRVRYAVQDMRNITRHTNFWKYAASYGFKGLKPGKGLTGNGLSGAMKLSADRKYWEATAIPVVPYRGDGSFNAYPVCTVTVRSRATGRVLARLRNVVLPVSDEMHCDNCHTERPVFGGILLTHDRLSGTTLAADLQAGTRHACNECHADPVLDAPGKPGVPGLSQAMHGFHADKMHLSSYKNSCYNCHPGRRTRCLRGVMARAGMTCVDCHGTEAQVAASIVAGRTPWLNEPDCGNAGCHPSNGSNGGRLYRQSYLQNGPEEMNGFILCEMCHNGTHAEWRSTRAIDNRVPLALQGRAAPVGTRCSACHQGSGRIHNRPGD